MPIVDVDPDELRRLAESPDISEDQLKDDLFALGLEYEGLTDDGAFRLEFAPDRLDRLSVEGVARSLRYHYGIDRGLHTPRCNDGHWTINVADSVPEGRPFVTGAIIRDITLTEDSLASLIQLQEKLHETIGRRREKAAIGIHDLAMLKGADPTDDGRASVTYRGISRDGDRFVPLDSNQESTPQDVLDNHPTGREYADLVDAYDRVPAIYDDLGLFSFPPIINGRRTEVTPDTRELFIELTGTDQWTIDKMLNIICYAIDARGGTIEAVTVEYPDHTCIRPTLEIDTKHVDHERIERTLGLELSGEEIVELIERSGLSGSPVETPDGLQYAIEIPPYRVDILHPVDLIDDIGRAYGFNELSPRYPDVSTVGQRHEASRFERAVRDVLVGLGFEDLLNFYLISERDNFDRMDMAVDVDAYGSGTPAQILEPYSEEYEIVRTWSLPSLFLVLENNTHRAYPQQLCDIGLAATVDHAEENNVHERRTLGSVIASPEASFEDAKAKLNALCRRFGCEVTTPPTSHPSFVEGRTAVIHLDENPCGVIGEFHPDVITEFDLEVPVVGFELDLNALMTRGFDSHE